MKAKKYDFESILNIFEFIGNLFCLKTYISLYNDDYRYGFGINPFLLTNTTGWFYFNTYMYAFVEGITLLGLPAGNLEYDGSSGCPIAFLDHDLEHTDTIINKYMKPENVRSDNDYLNEKGINIRNIYYTILSDDSLTQEEKEVCILMMWYSIHEADSSVVYNNETLTNASKLYYAIINDAEIFDFKQNNNLTDLYQPKSINRFRRLRDCAKFLFEYIVLTFDIPGGKEFLDNN